MIKINLLGEARAEKVARGPLISFGAANLNNYIVVAVLIVAAGWVGFTYWRLSSTLSALNAEVRVAQREYERLKPIIAEVEAFKRRNAELRRKIQVIERLKTDQFGPVRIMDEVSKALPDLLWLSSFDLREKTITVKGQALNENAVANFIANLSASPFFTEPNLRIMQQDRNGVFTFDLSVGFTYSPAVPGGAAS